MILRVCRSLLIVGGLLSVPSIALADNENIDDQAEVITKEDDSVSNATNGTESRVGIRTSWTSFSETLGERTSSMPSLGVVVADRSAGGWVEARITYETFNSGDAFGGTSDLKTALSEWALSIYWDVFSIWKIDFQFIQN